MTDLRAKLLAQLGLGAAPTDDATAPSAIADPLLAAIAARLTEARSSARPDGDDETERLIRANRRLRTRLGEADVVLRHAADLLGACPRCLGLVRRCRACHGRGGPGSTRPGHGLAAWLGATRRASAAQSDDLDSRQPIDITREGN